MPGKTITTVSLTFETDVPKDELLQAVLVSVRAHLCSGRAMLVGAHTYTDEEMAAVQPLVQLVVDTGGATGTTVTGFIDRADAAHAFAEEFGGVIVELPIDTDCRKGGAL